MLSRRGVTILIASIVFLVTAAVYFITLTPTVPFWDAGEFIAASYILGIPHPPGTPFYVLLGRIATLVPWQSVAERVNALSALPSALTVVLAYLTVLKLVRLVQRGERDRWSDIIAHVGGVTGALMLAFSDSFWENSIEAEVYALMSLAQGLVLWLGLRWWEEHERRPTAGPLLLCVYVMWLCVGLHLGVGIMGLPLMVLVWMVDRRAAVVFVMPLLAVLLVTMGMERMAGGVLLLSTIVFLTYAAQRKLHAGVAWVGAGASLVGMGVAFGDAAFTPLTAGLALAGLLAPLAWLARGTREGRILALAVGLMVLGYSTHAYLPIRAAQHPAINEGAPASWDALRDLLERKQYGQMNMFERRAPLSVQLNKEFWRYFSRQWPLFPSDRFGSLLPLLLGIAGGAWLAMRDQRAFLYTGTFLGLTTVGMIAFLNFSPNEVRERDYFFQSGYHAYALWIGVGVAWLVSWVRESFAAGPSRTLATGVAAVLLALQPVLLLRGMWFTHDRRGNMVARDYAYNMLAPLEPNSFMFTNGDNDTFPLWYIQQVEGFRKDVRVVNLSLLNTDWYIRQLRDDEPRVPIRLDDPTIKLLGYGAIRDTSGKVIYTNEFMVRHILNESIAPNGDWSKRPYFAVTVPEHFGYDPYFTLEGLVYRVNRDSLQGNVDEPKTRKAVYETFRYGGLFQQDGAWDATVFKDENAATLSRNYAAAHIQLALYYRRNGQLHRAIQEMERVERMFPELSDVLMPLGTFYLEAGDTARALGLFQRVGQANPDNPELKYYQGVLLVYLRRVPDAVRMFEDAIRLDPEYAQAYFAAYTALSESGQTERALQFIERWVRLHPEDEQAQQVLRERREALGERPRSSPMPRPPLPGLP